MEQRRGVTAFIVERCLPVYPILLTLWVCAAESMTTVLGGSIGPWRPSWDTAVKVLALMAAGVFMRMVDDQKDLDYDRSHHQDRPLVEGRVTPGELRRAMVPAAVIALACAAAVSPISVAFIAGALTYSVSLWWAETRFALLRDNAIANLAAVWPMQFLVTGFSMTPQAGGGDIPSWQLVAVPLVFTSALLHAEIARKTTRSTSLERGVPDHHSYSDLIGFAASVLIASCFGLFAVFLDLLVTKPWAWAGPRWPIAWLPLATAIFPLLSARTFLVSGKKRPESLPTLFVVSFFLSLIAQGLVRP